MFLLYVALAILTRLGYPGWGCGRQNQASMTTAPETYLTAEPMARPGSESRRNGTMGEGGGSSGSGSGRA
jgi:hypothetical protein